ncbi:3-oxoacyl-ACP reductase [Bacteroidia bacterium]|nr:3-oxoacyl-ACP reductase [Bacteroidia bacterium]
MYSHPQNPFSLSGKQILVTGASSGIGKAIAIACANMGATLYLTARNETRLKTTLQEMNGSEHRIFVADITCQADIDNLVTSLPPLDGVVHSAGIGGRLPCKMIDAEAIETVFSPNFNAPVLLQAALLSRKKVKKDSSIVFIASRAANAPSRGNAVYSASKGAIISYSKVLALELAERGIRVNCICPAMVWTDLIVTGGISKEELETAQGKYPLKRYGQPEDVAYLAIYLLSDASNWMTGSCIDITGGGEGILTL